MFFCQQAPQRLTDIDNAFIGWQIVPRFDKTLPELEYRVNGKGLTRLQAHRYLQALGQDLDQVEELLVDQIDQLIDLFRA